MDHKTRAFLSGTEILTRLLPSGFRCSGELEVPIGVTLKTIVRALGEYIHLVYRVNSRSGLSWDRIMQGEAREDRYTPSCSLNRIDGSTMCALMK